MRSSNSNKIDNFWSRTQKRDRINNRISIYRALPNSQRVGKNYRDGVFDFGAKQISNYIETSYFRMGFSGRSTIVGP